MYAQVLHPYIRPTLKALRLGTPQRNRGRDLMCDSA